MKNFRQYVETIMIPKKILRIKKTYKMSAGSDSINKGLFGLNRQFDCFEIYLAYDKSNKHTIVYNRCNVKLASKVVKSILQGSIA